MNLILFKRTCNVLLFITALLSPLPGIAQTVPPQIPPEQTPLPDPEPRPLPEPIPEDLPQIEPPRDITPQPPQIEFPESIFVREFEIIGNTAFTTAEIQKVLEPYVNRSLSFPQLQEAASQIDRLYQDNGYITSGAIVPAQEDISDGVITIEISEGRVSEINITGLNRLREGYVRSRVAKGAKAPLNRERLLLALQLLQLDPLIENINAELAAGADANVSVLNIFLSEADAFDLQLTLDNQRAPVVGSFRRKVDIEHINLLGFGDRFTVGYVNTDGSNALDNLSYTWTVNASNGTVSFRHNRIYSDLIYLPEELETPTNLLDIQTTIIESDLTYRQPLYQTPSREFNIGLTGSLSYSQSLDFGSGSPVPTSFEANLEGETRLSILRFFQEYVDRDREQVIALFSQFNLGLDVFDATIDKDPVLNPADGDFLSWRGQAQYLRLLSEQPPFTTLLLRGDFQLSNDFLLSREQFNLGGPFSVRGYRQNTLLGDNGLFLSAEIRQPVLSVSRWDLNLELAPFIDFGKVWNDRNSEQGDFPRDKLSSVGLGLILNIGQNFDARLDWGIALDDLGGRKPSLQENGVYFQIRYRPL